MMEYRDDYYFMEKALRQARAAYRRGEVPVGAVVVKENEVIARGFNLRESTRDPAAHAELLAIRRAARRLNSWRLTGCTLYVTLEPCPMRAGAILNSRIERVVFGAYDAKAGCCTTLYHLCSDPRFNHRAWILGGIMEKDCADILSSFFEEKRKKSIEKHF